VCNFSGYKAELGWHIHGVLEHSLDLFIDVSVKLGIYLGFPNNIYYPSVFMQILLSVQTLKLYLYCTIPSILHII
jgi:hypothetical protein